MAEKYKVSAPPPGPVHFKAYTPKEDLRRTEQIAMSAADAYFKVIDGEQPTAIVSISENSFNAVKSAGIYIVKA